MLVHNLLISSLLLTTGCVHNNPVTIPISNTINYKLGINGLYHGGCDYNLLDRMKSWNVNNRNIRVAISADYEIENTFNCINQSLPEAHITFLVEVIDDYLVTVLAGRFESFDVELVNEPDLNDSVTKLSWQQFLLRSQRTLQDHNGKLISGGLSNVQPDTLDWLNYVPFGYEIALHNYHDINCPTCGSKGYSSRTDENNRLKHINKPLHITEVGYPCLDGCDQNKVLASTKIDLAFLNDLSPIDIFWYQSVNGPSNTNIDRYALLPLIEGLWK